MPDKQPPALSNADLAAAQMNFRGLFDIVGDDKALLKELSGELLRMSGDLVAEMHSGLKDGNDDRVMRAAHTLKGSSGMLGAMGMMAAAAEIERAAVQKNLPVAAQRLEVLTTCRSATSAVFQALIAGTHVPGMTT